MSTDIQKENTLTPQEEKKQDEALKLKSEEELKSFTPEKVKDLINKVGELLTIDDYEKKEILKNLGDKAPDFLAEIKNADNEFKQIMKIKNNESQSLTSKEQEEKMNLFFEKLFIFKETNYDLLEKIDDNDGNWINSGIEATKFNEKDHGSFWDTPEALGDGLANGMLTKLNQYQNIFENGVEGLKKMLDAILDDPVGLIKSLWEEIKKELSNLLDFDGPTYKIAQTIGKFLVDVIIQLISGGAGIVGKLATTINKLIPDGIIKKGLNKTVDFSSNVITNSISINPKLLSKEGIKELGLKGTGKKLGNELMYYGGSTPYIIYNEGREILKSTGDLKNWIKETNKTLKEEGYKIPVDKMMTAITLKGEYVVQIVRLEKKLTPETKMGKEALKYLNLVEKGIKNITEIKFKKIAELTGEAALWNKRIIEYTSNKNDPNLENFGQSNLFKEFYIQLEKKYQNKKDDYIA